MTRIPKVVLLDGQGYQGGNAVVDVIVVPGYVPEGLWQWLQGAGASGPSTDWVRTFLAEQLGEFKEVRFLVYDYDASPYFRADIIQPGKVAECGYFLKEAIDSARPGQEKRPIIFLCHGLGVNIVNEALKEPELAEVTQAVLVLHHPASDDSPGPRNVNFNTGYIDQVPPGGPRVKVFTDFQSQGGNYILNTKTSGSTSTRTATCDNRTVREEILRIVKELKPPVQEPPTNTPSVPPSQPNIPNTPQPEQPPKQEVPPQPEVPPPPYNQPAPPPQNGAMHGRPDQYPPWGRGCPWPSFSGGTHVMPNGPIPDAWGWGYGPRFHCGTRVSPNSGAQPLDNNPGGAPPAPPAPPPPQASSGIRHHRSCTCQDCNASRHQAGLDRVSGHDYRRTGNAVDDELQAGLAWLDGKPYKSPSRPGDPVNDQSGACDQNGPHYGGTWTHSWGGGPQGHGYHGYHGRSRGFWG